MTTIDAREPPGWYGKLSSLGDFAHRRLSPQWIESCDAWLQRSIAASRERLGPRWLEVYLTAPLWRFAWAPGVVDARWWFGVLMPSCDSVGRYFPLLVCQPRLRAPADRIALDHLELWYEHLAGAALQTLRTPATLERFEAALRDAPPWPTPAGAASAAMASQPAPGSAKLRYSLGAAGSLAQSVQRVAVHELQARLAGCTLWWAGIEPDKAGALSIVRGLPEAASFAELLDGQW